jgi:sugar lactone lactonase YvrE
MTLAGGAMESGLIRLLEVVGKLFAVGVVALACDIGAARAAAPSVVALPGDRVYPESLTATSDGTLIIGSLGQGNIYRVPPGAANAELWVKQSDADFLSVLGVLADEKSGTLWVCSSDLSSAGVSVPGQKLTQLKALDLKSGKVKAGYVLPGNRTLCNDIVIAPDGSAYVTDSFQPHVLRLKPGAKEFEIWATDDRFQVKNGAGLDGIAFGGDGNLYVNLYNGNALFRIDVNKDGSAGKVTELQPSKPLALCDGMRKFGNNSLLMIEGTGSLDLITPSGDKADVKVVKSGFRVPVSVVQVGNVGWVLEGQLGSLFEPKKNGPPNLPFRAYAVPLPRE